MTTNPTPLQERIARALMTHECDQHEDQDECMTCDSSMVTCSHPPFMYCVEHDTTVDAGESCPVALERAAADLTELLWKTVVEVCDPHPEVFNDAPTDEVVAAVLPILRRAQAEAWDEGQSSGWDEAQCTWQETGVVGDGWKHSTGPNPYRGEHTNG